MHTIYSTPSALSVADCICVLLGIGVAQILFLGAAFSREYPDDYIWEVIKRMKLLATAVVAVSLVLALLLVLPEIQRLFSFRQGYGGVVQSLLLAVFAGILIVAISNGFHKLISTILPVDKRSNPLRKVMYKALTAAGIWALLVLGERLQRLLEQDNIDWLDQRPGFWYCGATSREAGRRVRILYEVHKLAIAAQRRNTKFLDYDANIHPGYHFYLLAKLLGRNRLRDELHNPPHIIEYDGEEKRRENPGLRARPRRIGDDPRVRQAVKQGLLVCKMPHRKSLLGGR